MADPANTGRVLLIDQARTVALVAMASFHFTFDLQMFGIIDQGTVYQPGWALYARVIANSFIFLMGVSLFLAHRNGIRWRSFIRREAKLIVAAGVITIATYFALPSGFIFFGILHSIALSSLVGLLFLRTPAPILLGLAAAVWIAPTYLRHEFFDTPILWWTGLMTLKPHSVDFEPFFPWFAPCLLGMAVARIAVSRGWTARMTVERPSTIARRLAWPGQHSLLVYLAHQPVLISLLWVATKLF